MTTSPASCVIVMKSGNLNFLEPSGSLQACNGTALPFYSHVCWYVALSPSQPSVLLLSDQCTFSLSCGQSEQSYLAKSVTDKHVFIVLPDAWLMKLYHTNCEHRSAGLCCTCTSIAIRRNPSHLSNMQDFGQKFHQKCLSRSTFIR